MTNIQEKQKKDQRLTKNIIKGILIVKYLHTVNSNYTKYIQKPWQQGFFDGFDQDHYEDILIFFN